MEAVLGHLVSPEQPLIYCIESTACYHLPLVRAWQGLPIIVNPVLAIGHRRKTDKLDAFHLSYHCLTGLWGPSYVPSLGVEVIRSLDKASQAHSKTAKRYLLGISTILLRFAYTFTSLGMGLNDSKLRPYVEDMCRHPDGLMDEAFSKDHGPGMPLPVVIREQVLEYFLQHDIFSAKAKACWKEVLNQINTTDWHTGIGPMKGKELMKLLQTVPGVGPKTAAAWLMEVGDITRIPNAKAATAYAGFDPSLKVSAGKVTANVRRKGNERLHYVFLQAAHSVMARQAEAIGQWGQEYRKKRPKGGYQRAVGSVARRLVMGIYYVHFKGEAFSYGAYKIAGGAEQCGEPRTGASTTGTDATTDDPAT